MGELSGSGGGDLEVVAVVIFIITRPYPVHPGIRVFLGEDRPELVVALPNGDLVGNEGEGFIIPYSLTLLSLRQPGPDGESLVTLQWAGLA